MEDPYEHTNPYASPQAEDIAPPALIYDTAFEEAVRPCPQCASRDVKPAPYDWWRGRRGPRAIDHVLCQACKCEYHGISGKPYPPAKSPMPLFIVAVVLFALYVVVYIGFNAWIILSAVN